MSTTHTFLDRTPKEHAFKSNSINNHFRGINKLHNDMVPTVPQHETHNGAHPNSWTQMH